MRSVHIPFLSLLAFGLKTPSFTGYATSDSAPTLDDPAERQAMDALEEGTKHLEDGNIEAARDQYRRSVEIQKSAAALFNLGVSPSVPNVFVM